MTELFDHVLREDLTNYSGASNLKFNEKINALKAAGEEIYHFGFGQSPFPVPDPFVKHLKVNFHWSQRWPKIISGNKSHQWLSECGWTGETKTRDSFFPPGLGQGPAGAGEAGGGAGEQGADLPEHGDVQRRDTVTSSCLDHIQSSGEKEIWWLSEDDRMFRLNWQVTQLFPSPHQRITSGSWQRRIWGQQCRDCLDQWCWYWPTLATPVEQCTRDGSWSRWARCAVRRGS